MMRLSIIIPVYNEAEELQERACALAGMLNRQEAFHPSNLEVIYVDGDSSDETGSILTHLAQSASFACSVQVLNSQKGRARQLNAGAKAAKGRMLWFLHCDTALTSEALATLSKLDSKQVWGGFDIKLSADQAVYRIIEFMINWRSRLSRIMTGDQGLFAARSLFFANGAFPDQALMEDIEWCRVMKRQSKPIRISTPITTSARKWQSEGVFKTIWLMWKLRARYALGAKPEQLVRQYYR